MDHSSQVKNLVKTLESSTVEDGLATLDQILSLQGQLETADLQAVYVDGLVKLLKKSPPVEMLKEIDRRLRLTPAYADNPERIHEHALVLVETAKARPTFAQALATADMVAGVMGYGFSLPLQKAHAEALFQASQAPGAKCLEVAEQIQRIPSFRDSAEIQFACARACCNATVQANNDKEISRALEMLEALPLREGSAEIQESLEKARRNRERFSELRVEARKRKAFFPKPALLAGGLLVAALVTVPVLFRSDKSIEAKPSPTAIALSVPENDLASYLEKTRAALAKQDLDQATTYGLMSLRLAESLGKVDEKNDSLDLLASAYTRLRQPEQALAHLQEISQSSLARLAERHLSAAQVAVADKQPEMVAHEMSMTLKMLELNQGPKDEELLGRVAAVCDEAELPSQGSQVWERLGDLARAAELAEAAGELDRALSLLKQLAVQQPKEKERVTEFRLRAATRALATAEAALDSKNLAEAQKQADTALLQLENVKKATEDRARALTVLAKVAYLQERFPEAVALARRAQAAAPNSDRKTRLEAYAYKDAEILTRDELMVDTFVFPPAKKSDKFYTYAYFFGAEGDFVTGGQEELFEAPPHEIVAGLRYSIPEQGIGVRLVTSDGRYYSFDFDAGGSDVLKPGEYTEERRTRYSNNNGPAMSFDGNGRGGSSGQSRFLVHELVLENDRVKSFAADFITGYDSRGAAYGKVRYNSHFE